MKIIEPCTLTIFGAGGNLSRRKLIPALFRLEVAKRLPEQVAILGCDITPRSREEWLGIITEIIKPLCPDGVDSAALARFCDRWHYFAIPPGDEVAYSRLQVLLEEGGNFLPNVVYYMAVRPADYPAIIEKLGSIGLLKQKSGWRRVVIEKPFGYDLLSAQTLQIGRAHV